MIPTVTNTKLNRSKQNQAFQQNQAQNSTIPTESSTKLNDSNRMKHPKPKIERFQQNQSDFKTKYKNTKTFQML